MLLFKIFIVVFFVSVAFLFYGSHFHCQEDLKGHSIWDSEAWRKVSFASCIICFISLIGITITCFFV